MPSPASLRDNAHRPEVQLDHTRDIKIKIKGEGKREERS